MARFPRATLRVRLDAGFAHLAIFTLLEDAGVEYVVAMAKNPVLAAAATPSLTAARVVATVRGTSARVFGETAYQAQIWPQAGRVVIKAEVVAHPGRALRDNPRFVVTNLRHAPDWLYTQIYAARGDSENRIKELHYALALGRTSGTRIWANQLRVLLGAAAYVLTQTLQLAADHTAQRPAQATRLRQALLRQALLTIGVQVVRSVRRLVLHLPRSYPEQVAWQQVARHLRAT